MQTNLDEILRTFTSDIIEKEKIKGIDKVGTIKTNLNRNEEIVKVNQTKFNERSAAGNIIHDKPPLKFREKENNKNFLNKMSNSLSENELLCWDKNIADILDNYNKNDDEVININDMTMSVPKVEENSFKLLQSSGKKGQGARMLPIDKKQDEGPIQIDMDELNDYIKEMDHSKDNSILSNVPQVRQVKINLDRKHNMANDDLSSTFNEPIKRTDYNFQPMTNYKSHPNYTNFNDGYVSNNNINNIPWTKNINQSTYKDQSGNLLSTTNTEKKNSNLDERRVEANGNFIEKYSSNHQLAHLPQWQRKFDWDFFVENANLRVFGFKTFRPNQREIINASLSGRDIFVCMPTGGGKSLTFQIPALVSEGVTLVVMPLLSLIQDQISFLKGLGINVLFLNAEGSSEIEQNYYELFHGSDENDRCKLIFLTPEKIAQSQRTMNVLKRLFNEGLLIRVVIDEAHCVSQWGREFRPDYLNLTILKREFPGIPILAITATAPNKIREDIINQLRMKDTLFFRSSYNRSNLYMEIRNKKEISDVVGNIANFIKKKYSDKTGLIYCSSRKDCEELSKKLRDQHGLNAYFYHANMKEGQKNEIQEKWKNDEIKIIVATVAFGMGINKADVRFVIHFGMPKSFEAYYQEIGRAGRDGNKSHCILYYNAGDRRTLEYLMDKTHLSKAMKTESLRKITEMVEFCEESCECRRVVALLYFDEKFDRNECQKMCDNCRKNLPKEEKDVTEDALKILECLSLCHKQNIDMTMTYLVDYLRGLKNNKNKNKKYPNGGNFFGSMQKTSPDNLKKLIRRLIILKYIDEILVSANDKVFCNIAISNEGLDYIRRKPKDKRIIVIVPLKASTVVHEPAGDSFIEKISEKEFDDYKHSIKDDVNPNEPKRRYNRGKNEIEFESNQNVEEYGFCTKDQFEELVDKLKMKRREILKEQNKKLEMESKAENYKKLGADDIFPLTGLKELCRKLPTTEKELNINYIFGVGAMMLMKYGKEFLPEIRKHIDLYQIAKSENEYYKVVNNTINLSGGKHFEKEQEFRSSGHKNDKDVGLSVNSFHKTAVKKNNNLIGIRNKSLNDTDPPHRKSIDEQNYEAMMRSMSDSKEDYSARKEMMVNHSDRDEPFENKTMLNQFIKNLDMMSKGSKVNDLSDVFEQINDLDNTFYKHTDHNQEKQEILTFQANNFQDSNNHPQESYEDFNNFEEQSGFPGEDDEELEEFKRYTKEIKDMNEMLKPKKGEKRHKDNDEDDEEVTRKRTKKDGRADYFKKIHVYKKINAAKKFKKSNNFI